MNEEQKPAENQKIPKWQDTVAFFVFRSFDSGHIPILLVMAGGLLGLFIITRNLDSPDALLFAQGFFSGKLFGPLGWVLAVTEIPLCLWILKKSKELRERENSNLRKENEAARVRLKQMELPLEITEETVHTTNK